jgi:hypothetical protein
VFGWIVIVILAVIAAGWSWMVFMGNAMSDAPTMGFQGLWWIVSVWVIVLGAVLYKIYG